MSKPTRANISIALRQQGHRTLRQAEWDDLAYELEDTPFDAYEMATAVIRQRARRQFIPRTDRLEPRPLSPLDQLLTAVHAAAARQEPAVGLWREENLPDGLVDLTQVESWIRSHAASLVGNTNPELHPLPFPGAGNVAHSILVHRGTALGDLWWLSGDLAERYDWQPGQATAFVLSDATPLIPAVRARTDARRASGRPRITLQLDPDAGADDVLHALALARRQVDPTSKRWKPPSDESMGMTAHAVASDARSWAACCKAWIRATQGDRPITDADVRSFRQQVSRTIDRFGRGARVTFQ